MSNSYQNYICSHPLHTSRNRFYIYVYTKLHCNSHNKMLSQCPSFGHRWINYCVQILWSIKIVLEKLLLYSYGVIFKTYQVHNYLYNIIRFMCEKYPNAHLRNWPSWLSLEREIRQPEERWEDFSLYITWISSWITVAKYF